VLQVIANLMVRPRRVRFKVLVAALKTDDRYGEKDHAMINQALDEARAYIMIVTLPILIPVALFSLAVTGICRGLRFTERWSPLEAIELMRCRDHELKLLHDVTNSRGTVRGDPRYRRLSELAFEIEVLRWPLVSLVTVAISLPALVLYFVAYGPREVILILPQLEFWFMRRLRLPKPTSFEL
jgi:hypothetical protein